jgi:type IV secretory pathway ATPase VirB11/archaellum biosynthesis ATPase
MVSEKSKRTIEALEQGRYQNSRAIPMGGVAYSARDVLVKAPLIAGLNVYYVGGTGEGKTQLGHDLLSAYPHRE